MLLAVFSSHKAIADTDLSTSMNAANSICPFPKIPEKPGDGKHFPVPGAKLSVHYTCALVATGETVDSSRGEHITIHGGITVRKVKHPLQVILDSGDNIKGFELALASMSLGERSSFRLPADLCYGGNGKGTSIPPDSDLDFDIELLGIDKLYA